MKKTKFLRHLTTFVVTLSLVLPLGMGNLQPVSAAENGKTPSQVYVEKMGKGWNLYNTYDAINTAPGQISDETAWGQPPVTKDQIRAVKNKGFKSIRIPMTAYTRYSYVDGHYVIDSAWLAKYKQTVDWAVEEGLYVMINLHHDSWAWLADWNGDKSAEEYKRYVDLWTQLADYFKDEPKQVCFETINEPSFNKKDTDTITEQDKLDMINQAGYDTIRKTGGNNAKRMIVIPVLHTATDYSAQAYNFITSLKDLNIIATVHNYSDWYFSSNIGREGFDEVLYQVDGTDYTPRIGVQKFYDTLYNTFIKNGIGVVIGEYGVLGNSVPAGDVQPGEKLKLYELMNYYATQKGICLMLWAGVVSRHEFGPKDFEGDPSIAKLVVAAIHGQRSSYATGFNETYLQNPDSVKIPLTLNDNKFVGIAGLQKGKDYTYDEATATVTLSKDFVTSKFNALPSNQYGTIAELVMKFNNGADWNQFLIKYTTPVLKPVTGTTTSGITIPVDFNGTKLRRASAYDESGNTVGPFSPWWNYIPFGSSFTFDYDKGISLTGDFFNGDSIRNLNGKITVHFEFYDGQVINYILTKDGTNVTGKSVAN